MRHRALPAVVTAVGLTAVACAGGPSPVAAQTTVQSVPPTALQACEALRFHPIEVWIDSEALHPGDTLPLKAVSTLGPAPHDLVPLACLVDWRIAPTGIASLSADRSSLTLTAEAPVGATLTLEVRAPEGPVARHVRIIEARSPAQTIRDAGPVDASAEGLLTGLWRQVEIACSGPQPSEAVRELEFRAPGRFWVTFVPFEGYRDYWGQVTFDRDAGRLALTIAGGNAMPQNTILSGPARLDAEGQKLILDGFNLGNAHHDNAGSPCRYVFAR